MPFEWDPEKNKANIEKHGISFDEANHIFDGRVLTWADDRQDYGEQRDITIGALPLDDGVLVVVHTERSANTRIISARKAKHLERKMYYDYLEKTPEGN